MKNIYFLIFLLLLSTAKAQTVTFADDDLRNFLATANCVDPELTEVGPDFNYLNYNGGYSTTVDANQDGQIQISEAEAVTSLRIFSSLSCTGCQTYSSFAGLEAFVNLKALQIQTLKGIETVTLDGILPNLEWLRIWVNATPAANVQALENLVVRNLPALRYTDVAAFETIASFTFEELPSLQKFYLKPDYSSTLSSHFTMNAVPAIEYAYFEGFKVVGTFDLSALSSQNLECQIVGGSFDSILFPVQAAKISIASKLPTSLGFPGVTYLKELTLSTYSNNSSPVTHIDFSAIAPTLETLSLSSGTNLTYYDFSSLSNLHELEINGGNAQNTLSFNGLSQLQRLKLTSARFSNVNLLDFSMLTNLDTLEIAGNTVTTGSFTTVTYNGPDSLSLFSVDADNSITSVSLGTLAHAGSLVVNGRENGNLSPTLIDFGNLTDADSILITGKQPANGVLLLSNPLTIAESFKIEHTSSLSYGAEGTRIVFLGGIHAPMLDLKGVNPVFETAGNQIGYLKMATTNSAVNDLENLDLTQVQIEKLEVLYNNSPDYGSMHKFITFSEATDLKEFSMTSYLTYGQPPAIYLLKELDFSEQPNLKKLNFVMANGRLERLLLKNGSSDYESLSLHFNDSLDYICYDDDAEADLLADALINVLPETINFNTYCSFNPGGEFYTFRGSVRWDENNDGCDAADLYFPNFSFNYSGANLNGRQFADSSGDYEIGLPAGTFSVTPYFENPDVFESNPANVNLLLNAGNPEVIQNFCVSAIDHQDLEIVLMPLNSAIAGFDLRCRISYRNNGNITMSG